MKQGKPRTRQRMLIPENKTMKPELGTGTRNWEAGTRNWDLNGNLDVWKLGI